MPRHRCRNIDVVSMMLHHRCRVNVVTRLTAEVWTTGGSGSGRPGQNAHQAFTCRKPRGYRGCIMDFVAAPSTDASATVPTEGRKGWQPDGWMTPRYRTPIATTAALRRRETASPNCATASLPPNVRATACWP